MLQALTRLANRLVVAMATATLPLAVGAVDGSVSVGTLAYQNDETGLPNTVLILNGQLEASQPVGQGGELKFKGVARYDTRDQKGSYLDLPIAKYSHASERWRVDVGFDTVFWGVAESQRVVNVINQPDLLRSLRADVTLGQPMLAYTWFGRGAKLEAFVLPYFRARRFGGSTFRTGTPWPVDDRSPLYESSRGARHVDQALRVSSSLGALDAGLSVFHGTLREPMLVPDTRARALRPFYQQGTQVGLDAQYTLGPTLFKLEAKHVNASIGVDHGVAVYGIEQVLGAVGGAPFDVSAFIEHNWDSRGKRAPGLYQNDLFVGMRLEFANTAATTLTVGLFHDLDYASHLARALLETRITDDWNLYVEGYLFDADDRRDAMFLARKLDQLTVRLTWNF